MYQNNIESCVYDFLKKLNKIVDIATIIEHIKPEIVAFNISLKSTIFTTFRQNYIRWKSKSKGDEKMPATKLQERARIKYVTPKQFMEQYSLSKSQAYKILARPEMQEAKIKTGEKQIRINLYRAFEIMQQIYS